MKTHKVKVIKSKGGPIRYISIKADNKLSAAAKIKRLHPNWRPIR